MNDIYRTCIKCGVRDNPIITYCEGWYINARGKECRFGNTQEHLHFECETCAYEWEEDCVDRS